MERPNDSKTGLRAAIQGILDHPARLRLALAVALLAIWYVSAFRPLAGRIAEASRQLADDRERLDLLRSIDELAREEARYKGRIPEQGGRNAWVRFLMDGLGERPLTRTSIDPQPSVGFGPHRAEVARVVVEGAYADLEEFVRWLESGPLLIRIDAIEIGPRGGIAGAKAGDAYVMQLVVMGVVA